MYRIQGVGNFKYFAGIDSLAQVATREDRVCVLNILGGESRTVTPVGHAYSGGNVVFGTSPGRGGQFLETPIGPIPVYNNVREGLDDGHRFNCGVVYLPPSGARDGVAELIRVNPDLRKIFIVTEKLSVHDAREIRAMGQYNGIDIFGGNSLGVADAWNQVRIGGALGGDAPGEALRPGSIAIFSNSGNFTTTIATYLRMSGWGTTTLISSGKDVYIHYAAPEFAYALANDERSKAAVLYVEPGGTYELDAEFTKPIVACVVGRWKAKLTRAVGHAGAMGAGDDDASAKERWFMEKFGVEGIFTPDRPVFSARGALVTNVAHIPQALAAVMRENGVKPDFEAEGNLSLKPWFASNQGLLIPPELDIPVVEAMAPYNEQIVALDKQIGAVFPRQSMKDASGASVMDPKTQVTSLHGISMLEAARHSVESNLHLALLRAPADERACALLDICVGVELLLDGDPALAAAQAAREAGNAPNAVLAAACAIFGPRRSERARDIVRHLVDRFSEAKLNDPWDANFDIRFVPADTELRRLVTADGANAKAEEMLAALRVREVESIFVRYIASLGGPLAPEAVSAAIAVTLAWEPLRRKRIARSTAELLPCWMQLIGGLLGASADAAAHGERRFQGIAVAELLASHSLTEIAYLALLGELPQEAQRFTFQTLIGLLLSNGPGTISAQGAKGAVSADGPETPERVQINKALIGFLSHCGYAHGGNGYEGIAFLLEQFRDSGLSDPSDRAHGIDLEALAARFAGEYGRYKAAKKASGSLDLQKIPGVHHPVFKDKPVNYDPREAYVRDLFERRGEYNVFHAYYHAVVKALFESGISRNVYCVNVDAVIAALLLKMLWVPYRAGSVTESALETAAFTLFLYARTIGAAAEIDDHLNRGRNMDTRTPASQCVFTA